MRSIERVCSSMWGSGMAPHQAGKQFGVRRMAAGWCSRTQTSESFDVQVHLAERRLVHEHLLHLRHAAQCASAVELLLQLGQTRLQDLQLACGPLPLSMTHPAFASFVQHLRCMQALTDVSLLIDSSSDTLEQDEVRCFSDRRVTGCSRPCLFSGWLRLHVANVAGNHMLRLEGSVCCASEQRAHSR